MAVARLDQLLEVAAKHQLLDQTTEGTERCRELDAVQHEGSRPVRAELMNVPEPPKRTPHLLVDEIVRHLHLSYPAGHLQRNAEMMGPPSHFLAQGNQPGGNPADGL